MEPKKPDVQRESLGGDVSTYHPPEPDPDRELRDLDFLHHVKQNARAKALRLQPEEIPYEGVTVVEEPLILPPNPVVTHVGSEAGDSDAPEAEATPVEFREPARPGRWDWLRTLLTWHRVGLDVGERTVKYVVVKRSLQGYRLVDCGIRPMPSATDHERRQSAVAEILATCLPRCLLRRARITTAVAGLQVFFHNLKLPNLPAKDLRQAVPWACRKHLALPLEAAVLDFLPLRQPASKNAAQRAVFVTAAQEELVLDHLELLDTAGVAPAKVSTVPAALWRLTQSMRHEHVAHFAALEIGASRSHIAFVRDGELHFAREIPTAGRHFTEALCGVVFVEGREIHISAARAERLKQRYGFPNPRRQGYAREGVPFQEISVMLRPVLEKLVHEVQRSIDFYREKFGVRRLDRIYLTGGGAILKNLDVRLAKELRLTVETLNPFDHIAPGADFNTYALEKLGPRLAVAAGLAVDATHALNLLPAAVRERRAVRRTLRRVAAAGLLVLVFLLAWSLNLSQREAGLEATLGELRQAYASAEPEVRRYAELNARAARLEAERERYLKLIGEEGRLVRHLKAVSHLIPENVALRAVRADVRGSQKAEAGEAGEDVVVLEGTAYPSGGTEGMNLTPLLMRLREARYFRNIALRERKVESNGALAFVLECRF